MPLGPRQEHRTHAMKIDILQVFFFVLFATACSSQDNPTVGTTRLPGPDGVMEVVTYSPEPLPAPWLLEQDLVIGIEYGNDQYMLRRPVSYAILEDGTHIILDSSPSQIRVYDSQGKFVSEFGQPGSGPTDLPSAMYFTHVTPISIDCFDLWSKSGSRRVQRWSVSGDLLSLQDMPEALIGPNVLLEYWDGFHFYVNLIQERRSYTAPSFLLVRSNPSATSLDTLYYLDLKRISMACFMIEAEMGWDILGSPLVTDDHRLYVTVPYEDWVHEVDLSAGKEIQRFRWNHLADVVSDTLITRFKGAIVGGQDMEAGARWLRQNLSAVGLAAAPNGEIWVQRSPERLAFVPVGTWIMDVFSSDGTYRGRLQAPCPPETLRPFGGFLYGIGQNGEAPALIRYRLIPTGDG
jgi:hypothetical protein